MLKGTYRGSGIDCAHPRGGGLQRLTEHGDQTLCLKEKRKNQSQAQLMDGGEMGVAVVLV